jgi:geranylgeranyl diphosphate synthase type I
MLRPALCLLCCEALGGDRASAMPAAVAIELLHNITLIHDDIEDASETRHGRPALWRVAGIAQAINAGDGLFVIAQRTLLDLPLPPERIVQAARVLNDACIALCEGQYADIGFEARDRVTPAEYAAMIRGKTAALLGASAALGAIAVGADDGAVGAFQRCGELLGVAFQVQDDALGAWGDAQVTGKPVADDIRLRKKSFPVVYAFEHLDDARRGELERLYGAPLTNDEDVAAVLDLLDAAGARSASTTAAQHYAADALAAIRDVPLDRERRADIEALAAFFVERSM